MTTDITTPAPMPRVARFEYLAYGLFLHWGLYSQFGRGEWIQFLEKIPQDEYVNPSLELIMQAKALRDTN